MTTKRGRPNRRIEIVAAARTILMERGLNGMTTRAVAEAVPCSEGAIYVHFQDRLALILEVMHDSLPAMLVPLEKLLGKVGKGSPEQNLIEAFAGLARFHRSVTPMLCSLVSEQELLGRFRQSLARAGKGPHRGIATLANYIEQEQQLDRINSAVHAKTAAKVMMATSFFHQFTALLFDSPEKLEAARVVQLALSCQKHHQ